MNGVHDAERLKELQALPLSRKILITQTRIIEWYQHFNGCVCVSFSGGKDSTVLLDIVRKIYPDVPAVFSNTGLEYPEIQKFVKGYDNVDIVTPDMRFDEVIKTYGYPLIGKEVAEAIHYARRIRGPERESTSGKNFAVKESRVVGKQTEWKRLECRGGSCPTYPDGNSEKSQNDPPRTMASRGSEWHDWRRGCL